MYLTIKQHDMFRTLLMGFEIPYRAYIADVITSRYLLLGTSKKARFLLRIRISLIKSIINVQPN